jgi:DNA topoisomerase-3
MRFWKDTSGRYLDRNTVQTLLRDGKTGVIEGFTARSGRTYRARIEIDREAWQLKVRSEGWDEGNVIDVPEYEVNPEPLGRCPFEEECSIVESPTQFVCERALKDESADKSEERPKSCGFVLPRTVCKREITREEALHYLANRKTELLSDFTSRFGRPFAATLVLKTNGRHGFEFQPRGKARGEAAESGDAASAQAAPAEKTAAAKPPKRRRAAAARKPDPLTSKVVRKAKRKSAPAAARRAKPAAKPAKDR